MKGATPTAAGAGQGSWKGRVPGTAPVLHAFDGPRVPRDLGKHDAGCTCAGLWRKRAPESAGRAAAGPPRAGRGPRRSGVGGGVEGGAGGFAPEEAKRLGKEESPFTKFEDTPQTSFPTLKSERYRPAFSSESSSSCHMCDKKTLKHTRT